MLEVRCPTNLLSRVWLKVDNVKLLKPLTSTKVDGLESAKEIVYKKEPQIDKKPSGKPTNIKPTF